MMSPRRSAEATLAAALVVFCLYAPAVASQDRPTSPGLAALLPKLAGWNLAEAPRAFFPDDLFEYIDGAAESYLSYDFRELLVADLTKEGTDATLTLEIYDMGLPVNAFGIFAAERYPENKPVPLGDLGYAEGEALNFQDGRFYVKMLAFGLPALVAAFPKDGLVARSEKYVKKNFMGYEFLHDGYVATYASGDRELEGFFIDGGTGQESEAMLTKLLEALKADGQAVDKTAAGFHARNRYGQHLYIGRAGSFLCGAMRVPDGLEPAGEKLLRAMTAAASAVRSARQ